MTAPSNHRAARRDRGSFRRVMGALVALVLVTGVIGMTSCAGREGTTSVVVERPSADGSSYESDAGESSDTLGVAPTTADLREVHRGTPGKELALGDLSVMLEVFETEERSGTASAAPTIRPWTERLVTRVVVRNVGAGPVAISLRHNYPEVRDDRGHERPMLESESRISAEGLVRDDSGRGNYDQLGPGGVVAITQMFEIRTDDRERSLSLSLRVTPEQLVSFRLW